MLLKIRFFVNQEIYIVIKPEPNRDCFKISYNASKYTSKKIKFSHRLSGEGVLSNYSPNV